MPFRRGASSTSQSSLQAAATGYALQIIPACVILHKENKAKSTFPSWRNSQVAFSSLHEQRFTLHSRTTFRPCCFTPVAPCRQTRALLPLLGAVGALPFSLSRGEGGGRQGHRRSPRLPAGCRGWVLWFGGCWLAGCLVGECCAFIDCLLGGPRRASTFGRWCSQPISNAPAKPLSSRPHSLSTAHTLNATDQQLLVQY